MAIGEWLQLLRRWNFYNVMIAGAIGISTIVTYWRLHTTNITSGSTSVGTAIATIIIFNLLLFILAVILIRVGVARGNRYLFWVGMLLVALQFLSRLLEYTDDLMLMSLVLFGCGVGAIAAGLWFEHYVRG